MAEKKEVEDLELGEAGKGNKKKLIIIIAAAVLLIGGGVAGFLLMKGGDKKPKAAEHSEQSADEEHGEEASDDAEHDEAADEEHGEEAAEGEEHAEEAPEEEAAEGEGHAGPVYLELGEPIIANLPSEKKSRTIKVNVVFVIKNAAGEAKVKKHLPLLKSELLMMLSSTTVEALSSAEGQQTFREHVVEKMKETVAHEEKKPYIEKVLFTQFIMQ